jgi:Predicted transcriptional regulator with C-terminal CBS domains
MDESIERIDARADSLVQGHIELLQSLVSLRKKHKLTQGDVAERMSVSQSAVSQFERYDSNPTLATLRRYALAVGARVEERVLDDCEEHAPFQLVRGLRVIQGGRMETETPKELRWADALDSSTPRVAHVAAK